MYRHRRVTTPMSESGKYWSKEGAYLIFEHHDILATPEFLE